MSDNNHYNGWTNYETWTIALYIDNDESLYGEVQKLAEGLHGCKLADAIRELIEENNPLVDDATLYSQLLDAAISSANWDDCELLRNRT